VLCSFFAAPLAGAQAQGGAWQLSAIPAAGRLDYEVIREGEEIGTHSVTFWHEGRHLVIVTRTNIAVKLLGIKLYGFQYEAEEHWLDGGLTRLTSRTNNDGEMLTVNLAKASGRLRGVCNGTFLDLPADLLPISVWHPDFVRQSLVLDQYKCVRRRVRATDRGVEPILAGMQSIGARHYTIAGDLNRDVWYGPDGRTVKVVIPDDDGSEIAFVMSTPSQLPLCPASVGRAPCQTFAQTKAEPIYGCLGLK
jgi:hypothetical protein